MSVRKDVNLPMTKQLGHPQMIPVIQSVVTYHTKTCGLVQKDSSVRKGMQQRSLSGILQQGQNVLFLTLSGLTVCKTSCFSPPYWEAEKAMLPLRTTDKWSGRTRSNDFQNCDWLIWTHAARNRARVEKCTFASTTTTPLRRMRRPQVLTTICHRMRHSNHNR